ncbi:hypothetical protein [Kaarinaea lacus]
MEIAEYPYKPKPFSAIMIILFCGAFSSFIGSKAMTNDRGLILNKVIEFSTSGATIFYWILTGVFILSTAAGLFMLAKSFSAPRFVRLTEETLISPKSGFSKNNIIIPYKNITNLSFQKVKSQIFLIVHYSGKKISIPQSLLPDEETFNEFCSKLSKNIES